MRTAPRSLRRVSYVIWMLGSPGTHARQPRPYNYRFDTLHNSVQRIYKEWDIPMFTDTVYNRLEAAFAVNCVGFELHWVWIGFCSFILQAASHARFFPSYLGGFYMIWVRVILGTFILQVALCPGFFMGLSFAIFYVDLFYVMKFISFKVDPSWIL